MRRASFLAVVGARLWRKRPAAAVVARNTDRMERTRYALAGLSRSMAFLDGTPENIGRVEQSARRLRWEVQGFTAVGGIYGSSGSPRTWRPYGEHESARRPSEKKTGVQPARVQGSDGALQDAGI